MDSPRLPRVRAMDLGRSYDSSSSGSLRYDGGADQQANTVGERRPEAHDHLSHPRVDNAPAGHERYERSDAKERQGAKDNAERYCAYS